MVPEFIKRQRIKVIFDLLISIVNLLFNYPIIFNHPILNIYVYILSYECLFKQFRDLWFIFGRKCVPKWEVFWWPLHARAPLIVYATWAFMYIIFYIYEAKLVGTRISSLYRACNTVPFVVYSSCDSNFFKSNMAVRSKITCRKPSKCGCICYMDRQFETVPVTLK